MMASLVRRGAGKATELRTSTASRVQAWRQQRQESASSAPAQDAPATSSLSKRMSVAASGVRTKVKAGVSSAKQWQEQRTAIATNDRGTTAAADTPAPEAVSAQVQEAAQVPTITTRLVTSVAEPKVSPTPATPARAPRGRAAKLESPLEEAQEALSAKEYERAEDILVGYIVKHTKDTDAYMMLGEAALGREDWQEATEIFEQVVSWNPKQAGVHAGLGLAAYRAGRYSMALQALQRAHEFEPENVTILTDLLSIAKKMDIPALQHSINEKLQELAGEASPEVSA